MSLAEALRRRRPHLLAVAELPAPAPTNLVDAQGLVEAAPARSEPRPYRSSVIGGGMRPADEVRRARAYLLGVAEPRAQALADLVGAWPVRAGAVSGRVQDEIEAALGFRDRRAA